MFKKAKSFLFENRTLRQTVLKNAFWLGIGQFAGRFIRAIIIIYAARVLGAAGYGVFSYALSLSAFFVILTDLGINGILTREVSKHLDLRKEYFSTALLIKLILTATNVLLIIFIAPLFTKIEEALPLLPIVAILLAVDTIRDFGFAFTRALEKMQIEAGVFVFTNIAVVVLSIAALMTAPTSINLAIGYTAGSGLGTLIMIFILRKEYFQFLSYIKKELVYPMFNTAWPFALLGVLGGVMVNMDTIMLGWFRDAAEVGIYAAAHRPIQFLYVPAALLASSVFPVFSRLAGKNNEKMKNVLEKALVAIFLLSVPLTIGGVILAPEIITLVYGNEYLRSISAFQLLLVTLIPAYAGAVINNAIFAYDKQRIFLVSGVLGIIGNFGFNVWLIPIYGIIGAAIATIVAQLLTNGFSWWKLKKINPFKTTALVSKILLASVLMAILTVNLKLMGVNVFVNLAVSAAAYLFFLAALKESLIKEFKNVFI